MKLAFLFVLIGISWGQDTKVFLEPLNISNFPLISVQSTLSVNTVLNTKKVLRDFELYEDLVKIEDYQVGFVKDPKKIALVIDTSGSVKSFMTEIKTGVHGFINGMDVQDKALVVSFSGNVRLKQDLTTDKSLLSEAVESLSAKGGTRLYDGLYGALGKLPYENSIAILFTDGKDQYHPDDNKPYSKNSLNSAITRSRQKQIPVFVIGIGDGTDENVLSNIAQSTGGQYFKVDGSNALSSIYAQISMLLKARIQISYESPNKNFDGKLRRVTFKEVKTKVQHQRVYAIGETNSSFAQFRSDWFDQNAMMDVSSLDFSKRFAHSYSADTQLLVEGGKPSLKPGALSIVGPSSSVDLSNPFNPKIVVDPGSVNFKAPELNISPLKVDSTVDLKSTIGGSWGIQDDDDEDDNEVDNDDEMDWTDDD